ncbi:MAG: hypothetical protein AVDCRST_MAG88-3336 [uncultured Thermomicrobiales bacterium]|uniref:Major facilitator superfamily (MFS) profile domain-containing protein n=1 Tax=uncultured Thermomicrobiales bacterium TaxID=1645740 RepID=A0A6J4VLX3_9BACT|nr:MAG: hypothetical protein AVDCRST_MAG88-3336 [uncultured Thermomicrobiales bacterium]
MVVAVRSGRGGLWRHPDFLKLWTGQTISLFGSRVTGIALPFAAILLLGASPAQIALLGAARLAAGLIAGPFAGVWVDRLPRRPLLIAADLGRALLLGSIPLAAALGLLRIEQLSLVTLLTGMLGAVFDVAYRSYLPSLVRRDELVEGNSKLEASGAVAEVAGFGLGGFLVQALTAPLAILIDALSFLVSAVSLLLIRTKESPPRAAPEAADDGAVIEPGTGPGIWSEIGEGLRLVLRDPVLRAVVGAAGTLELFRNMIGVVFLLYLTNQLGLPPAVQGAIFAVGGISSLGGALVAERVTRRFGLGRALVGGLLVSGIATLFLPLGGGPLALAVVLLVAQQILGDGAATAYAINQTSLLQASTPDRLLGRANASVRFVEVAATLLSLALGAFLGERFGLRPTLWVAALGVLLAPLWLLRSPVSGLQRLPEQA